jgi:anti-sigma B factor antagonist
MTSFQASMLDIRSLPTGRGVVIVALAGEVDISSVAELRAELVRTIDAGAKRIVVDATDLRFMDSRGASALRDADRQLRERGGGLSVHDAAPAVQHALVVCGVSQHMGGTSAESDVPGPDRTPPPA